MQRYNFLFEKTNLLATKLLTIKNDTQEIKIF